MSDQIMARYIPQAPQMNWSVGVGNYEAQHQLDFALANGVLIRAAEAYSALDELAIVKLREPRTFEGGVLPVGSEGTVVHSYRNGAAYEVEFAQPFHCVMTVRRADIEPV